MRDRLKSLECSKFLKALADPERLKIVQCLQRGPRTVGQVVDEMKMPIANVSHHLRLLKNAGVVESEKQGRFVSYRLAEGVAQGVNAEVLEFGCCRIELGKKDAGE
jgi:ArsR family transcriptional regulator, nickel/cobalt-responsive transcriptional repressor